MADQLQQRLKADVEAAVASYEAVVRAAHIPDAAHHGAGPNAAAAEKGAGDGAATAAAHRLLLAIRSLLDLAASLRRAALVTDFDFQAAAVQQEVVHYEARATAAEAEVVAVQSQIRAAEESLRCHVDQRLQPPPAKHGV